VVSEFFRFRRSAFASQKGASVSRGAGRLWTLRFEMLEDRRLLSGTAQPQALATRALLEGPAAGRDSDVVTLAGAWTATANAPWLHTSSSGNGNGLAAFSFSANSGATRTGTITIADQTLTVTQAGSGYVAASALTNLTPTAQTGGVTVILPGSPGLFNPQGVAVDSSGNVYVADSANIEVFFSTGALKEWNAATQTSTTLDFVQSYLHGLAVDGAGNVYFINNGNNTIGKWNAATRTTDVPIVLWLSNPSGVAVDGSGNLYIADSGDNTIKKWNLATQTLSTLISSVSSS
jgi:trimeric autotransporter adhesin